MKHDSSYKHWEGKHLGIWSRRAVIAANGLKSCLEVKWMRRVITLSWAAAMLQVALLFFLGQLLIADSVVVQWLGNLNPQLQSIGRALVGWLEQHPEVSVRTTYNLLFYYFSSNLLTLTLIAIALAMPHLITRDLSSNAIIVYSSKAVGRFDYLFGKFATLFCLMTLTWLGPVCVAWFLGNLLSTNWHFFWHSRAALSHVLSYVLCSMLVLGVLALGVSAISSRAKATVSLWIALWLLGAAFIPIGFMTKPWLKFFSLTFNLEQISLAVFKLKDDFQLASDNIPLFGNMLRGMRRQTYSVLQNPETTGAICGLGIMLALAVVVIVRKVKPE
jgi:ABC-2 type transport system permease protein